MENRVQKMYETTAETTADVIDSQPLAAVAAAFGLGLVAGLLVAGLIPATASRNSSRNDWSQGQIYQFGKQMLDGIGSLAPAAWKS